MEYVKPHSRDYTLAVAALFLGSFVTFADLYSTQPIIPALSKEFQVSPAVGSLSLSVATGALAVFMLITPGKNASKNKAHAASLYLLFYYLGSSLVGSTGGIFWSNYGWQGVILCISILLFVALPLSFSIPHVEAQNKGPCKYSPF